MAEGSDIDELVDFDEVSYMEEPNEDVDGVEDDTLEETDDGKADEPYEELGIDGSGKEQLSEPDQSPIGDEHGEGEDKYTALVNERDKEKHSELLSHPPHGSEVFFGGLPKDVTEEDLTVLCEPIGEIFEVRLMKNKDTGEFQGCAFVAFKTKEDGQRAIEELQNKEFKGKTLRCSLYTKNRLYIHKIPKSWSADQFQKMIHEVGPGAEIIDLKQDASTPGCNRGFAFVSYYNHACADYARQKMSNGSFELEGNNPSVSWAYQQTDFSAASQERKVYVKNIPDSVTHEQLEELFQRHGEITKVMLLPSDGPGKFSYIHFGERSSALEAVKGTEKYEIDGQILKVAMAKPWTNKKTEATYPPPTFGFAGNPYDSFGASYRVASGYQQPVTYGSGQIPSGMQMVPMALPNSQIDYVLQPPGMQQQMSTPVPMALPNSQIDYVFPPGVQQQMSTPVPMALPNSQIDYIFPPGVQQQMSTPVPMALPNSQIDYVFPPGVQQQMSTPVPMALPNSQIDYVFPPGMQQQMSTPVPMALPNSQIDYVLWPPRVQQQMSTPVQPLRNDHPNGSGSSEGRGKDGDRSRRFRPY